MIICCGEALIDMIQQRSVDGKDLFLPIAGGAIFNTAIALGRLGISTGFVSGISTDLFGDQIIQELEKSQVQTDYCIRSNQPSTLAFVKLNKEIASYSFFDENSAGRNLSASAIPGLPEKLDAMHFGGISLISEPCGSAFEGIQSKNRNNTVISLDPNIRSDFIKNPTSHRTRILRMIGNSDIVKVSDEDLEWTCDGTNPNEMLKSWLLSGTTLVIVTKGGEGATAHASWGNIHIPAFEVEIVDTIGAGDTFNAGLLAGLKNQGLLSKQRLRQINSKELSAAIEYASKVAAYTVTQSGANSPTKDQIQNL